MKKQTVFIIKLIKTNKPVFVKTKNHTINPSNIYEQSDVCGVHEPSMATEFKTWDEAHNMVMKLEDFQIYSLCSLEIHTYDVPVYDASITGGGTRQQIIKALMDMADAIESIDYSDKFTVSSLESPILMTELREVDAEENNITE